ncbi:M15 family metallopeptidase [Oceanobacillus sp. FSL W7-1309]|jgi:peptidoglycan L-alanyl-D-glutamate endopeptidase CwlK|uniref:M15 family metallopeptidase n=1 Tax=Oceanobacillus sp. FSL W7-1309 TaxID=2954539 RepID=UPI0030FA1C65
MKRWNATIVSWIIIILFLVLLFYVYNEWSGEHRLYIDEDAPLPDGLHPIVEENQNELIEIAASVGIDVIITQGFRSFEQQDSLYEQGRTKPGDIITNAQGGQSYHNYGLAIDYALRNQNGEIIWDIHYDGNNNGHSDWFEVADIAKELGFDWGGDWSNFKDYPHLQMTFGLSLSELQRGYRPPEDNLSDE